MDEDCQGWNNTQKKAQWAQSTIPKTKHRQYYSLNHGVAHHNIISNQ